MHGEGGRSSKSLWAPLRLARRGAEPPARGEDGARRGGGGGGAGTRQQQSDPGLSWPQGRGGSPQRQAQEQGTQRLRPAPAAPDRPSHPSWRALGRGRRTRQRPARRVARVRRPHHGARERRLHKDDEQPQHGREPPRLVVHEGQKHAGWPHHVVQVENEGAPPGNGLGAKGIAVVGLSGARGSRCGGAGLVRSYSCHAGTREGGSRRWFRVEVGVVGLWQPPGSRVRPRFNKASTSADPLSESRTAARFDWQRRARALCRGFRGAHGAGALVRRREPSGWRARAPHGARAAEPVASDAGAKPGSSVRCTSPAAERKQSGRELCPLCRGGLVSRRIAAASAIFGSGATLDGRGPAGRAPL